MCDSRYCRPSLAVPLPLAVSLPFLVRTMLPLSCYLQQSRGAEGTFNGSIGPARAPAWNGLAPNYSLLNFKHPNYPHTPECRNRQFTTSKASRDKRSTSPISFFFSFLSLAIAN